MLPDVGEAQRGEGAFHLGAGAVVDGEFGEGVAGQLRGPGQPAERDRGVVPSAAIPPLGDPLLQRDQGPLRVDGGTVGRRLPVDVVEHLQRQRTPVARVEHRPGERGEVEGALPGEQPVVPAPLEHVHAQFRGVGELEEEQLVGIDGVQPGQVVAPGEHVEAVQAQPEGGMVGAPDDLGRVPPGVDVPAPRQRLVGDAESACGGPLGEGVQMFGGEVVVVDGVR